MWSESPRGFNLLANGLSLMLLAVIVIDAWVDPAGFARYLLKDTSPEGPGAFENLTVIALVPAVLFGLYAFWLCRNRPEDRLMSYWILAWSMACFYFFGEEISWGQSYLHWASPDSMTHLNRQGETNLHNISSWLNQKPRALVELFILVAGFLAPGWRLLKPPKHSIEQDRLVTWTDWILAPIALLSAGLLYVVTRIAHEVFLPANHANERE